MLGDISRIGPILSFAITAMLILIWDFLPHGKPFPPARGKALLGFALLGPAVAAIWTGLLLYSDVHASMFAGSAVLDNFSYFFFFLFAGISAAVLLSSHESAKSFGEYEGEFYALILFATGAMLLLSASRDLILIFVSLELTSISQYIMTALQKDERSTEAGIKYLLMGAISSAVILYGMALLFGLTGTTRLVAPDGQPSIAAAIAAHGNDQRSALLLASAMLTAGLGFKMSVVPFQMWTPDVYQGAPAPVAAFLSVASKAAGFAVALRIFFDGLPNAAISGSWSTMFAIAAAISMCVGNLFALNQSNIRRLLGYSSIAQAGNFMVGLAAITAVDGGRSLGASGVLFFIASYALTNLGAFIAIIAISSRIGSDEIADYAGLAKRSPWLAGCLALAMVSLTGIPPTAGFVAKLYIFNAAIQSDLTWLVIVAVLNSVVSAFYYLKVARIMFMDQPEDTSYVHAPAALKFALSIAAAGILFVGVLPSPLLHAARDAASVFGQ
jgi:NADH-quinone oxidoreductase subunit N